VANRHFAEIGDVWKHLPLAEILERERPGWFVETHAGSAVYPLGDGGWERRYGVGRFRGHATPALERTRYARELAADPSRYPGSPALALRILGPNGTRFRFCDLDPESLDSIAAEAERLGIERERVRLEARDGIEAVGAWVDGLAAGDRSHALVHVDGYWPFRPSPCGRSCADLFAQLARAGVRAVLWYGFHREPGPRRTGRDELDRGLARLVASEPPRGRSIWRGEVRIAQALRDPGFDLDPGVHGCGILTAGLEPRTVEAVAHLARELVRAYEGAELPGGGSGELEVGEALRPRCARAPSS